MKLTIPFRYTEAVVPPRCRKPRDVVREGATRVTVHEVSAREAPVAIVQRTRVFVGDRLRRVRVAYRWWRGRLWTPAKFSRAVGAPVERQTAAQFRADPWPCGLSRREHEGWHASRLRHERVAEVRAWAREVLFVDGRRYGAVGEPRYVVMTFGLGYNHGIGWGTSLSTDTAYNSNVGRDRYFRCDQYGEAAKAAVRIALARGDTKALPIAGQDPDHFEVLIPAAVRLCSRRQHGRGNTFTNAAEALIQASGNATTAAVSLVGLALRAARGEHAAAPRRLRSKGATSDL